MLDGTIAIVFLLLLRDCFYIMALLLRLASLQVSTHAHTVPESSGLYILLLLHDGSGEGSEQWKEKE